MRARVLMKDRFVREALDLFPQRHAGPGRASARPSLRARWSRAATSSRRRRSSCWPEKGAVGDICLRFFDAAGRQVVTELNDRVISMELDQLREVRRVVGVAGGRRKTDRHPRRSSGKADQRSDHRPGFGGAVAGRKLAAVRPGQRREHPRRRCTRPMMPTARTVLDPAACRSRSDPACPGPSVPSRARKTRRRPQCDAGGVRGFDLGRQAAACRDERRRGRAAAAGRARGIAGRCSSALRPPRCQRTCYFLVKGEGMVTAVDTQSRVGPGAGGHRSVRRASRTSPSRSARCCAAPRCAMPRASSASPISSTNCNSPMPATR